MKSVKPVFIISGLLLLIGISLITVIDDIVFMTVKEDFPEFPEPAPFDKSPPINFVDRNNFNPHVLLEPVRPIDHPTPIPAKDVAQDVVYDNELVLGIEINGEARAYPINMLNGPEREIVNDTLGWRRIAATW